MARILIDGATGYLGSHLTNHLLASGMSVRCLVRAQANIDDVNILKNCGAEIIYGDLHNDKTDLTKAFENVEVAIHLIGSVAPKRHESFTSLHVEQTKSFAELSLKSGVNKVIMVTAIGAGALAKSAYLRTKWEAEEVLRKSGLNCIFLRPSLLIGRSFGKRDSKLVHRLKALIESRRMVPLINGGKNKIQPLFINDMVEAVRICIQSQPANSADQAPVLELGGPTVLTMKEFLQELMNVIGVQKPLITLPIPIATVLAKVSQSLQEVPVLSEDQVKLSMRDNICAHNAITEELGITPIGVRESLESYTIAKKDKILQAN
jgi:nucleoside-diphosphate-sugar epimerase